MQTYKAPLRDMRFVLHELHGDTRIADLPGYADFTPDLIDSILEEAGKVAEDVLLPLNASGDEEGCHYENGVVRTPKGFRDAYRTFREGGWTGIECDPQYGGQGLAHSVAMLVNEMFNSANMAFSIYRWMLTRLVETDDRITAQELVGVFTRSQINPILDELAKEIWLSRKRVPLDALKDKKLALT